LQFRGKPYDTLDEVIGIRENPSSLQAFGIKYKQIDLKENELDIEKILKELRQNKTKLIHIQRSKGYSTRKSLSIRQIEEAVKEIRKIDKEVIIFVDNCYCEFVERKTPLEVGADIAVRFTYKKSRRRDSQKRSLCCRKERICKTYCREIDSTRNWKSIRSNTWSK